MFNVLSMNASCGREQQKTAYAVPTLFIFMNNTMKEDFNYLLKHSENVAKEFWSSRTDDAWDDI